MTLYRRSGHKILNMYSGHAVSQTLHKVDGIIVGVGDPAAIHFKLQVLGVGGHQVDHRNAVELLQKFSVMIVERENDALFSQFLCSLVELFALLHKLVVGGRVVPHAETVGSRTAGIAGGALNAGFLGAVDHVGHSGRIPDVVANGQRLHTERIDALQVFGRVSLPQQDVGALKSAVAQLGVGFQHLVGVLFFRQKADHGCFHFVHGSCSSLYHCLIGYFNPDFPERSLLSFFPLCGILASK